MEAEAIVEGGVRQWLKIKLPSKEEFKKELLLQLLVYAVMSPLNPACSSISDLSKRLINQLLTPAEILRLQKEKDKAELEYQIAWYRNECLKLADTVNNNTIAKRSSNFYLSAKNCSKISSIEVASASANRETMFSERVDRKDFDSYILDSDELDPQKVDEAIIEIVSPVLKKGKYKWSGIYNGEVIQFSVTSNEFKTLVQTGEVSFKNGTSIKCQLIIKRKLDA